MPFLLNRRHPSRWFRQRTKTTLLFPGSELPGRYYCGDGRGYESLNLFPEQTFAYSRRMEGVFKEDKGGKWALDGDCLVVTPERPFTTNEPSRLSARLIPVKWEQRIYLVEEHYMPFFCYRVTRSTVSVYGRNKGYPAFEFLKFPPDKPNVYKVEEAYPPLNPDRRPLFPERYRTFYEQGPIRARVVKILPRGEPADIPGDALRVLLDKGIAARVKPGLLLAVEGSSYATLIVTVARPDKAEAVRVDLPGREPDAVRVGDTLTSGERYYFPYPTSYHFPPWTLALHATWDG